MNYFEQKLRTILSESEVPYLNPDTVYGNEGPSSDIVGHTFIDTGDTILYGDISDTHHNILAQNEDYVCDLIQWIQDDHGMKALGGLTEYDKRTIDTLERDWIGHYALLGRAIIVFNIGPEYHYPIRGQVTQVFDDANFETPALFITYWNDNGDIHASANKIVEKMQISSDMPVIVSTPRYKTFKLNNTNVEKKELTPEEQQELDLMRQLHLMRPEQKKAAMKQLGLGSSGKPSAGQRAGLTPGQKYWAMSSEGKE